MEGSFPGQEDVHSAWNNHPLPTDPAIAFLCWSGFYVGLWMEWQSNDSGSSDVLIKNWSAGTSYGLI